MDRSSIPYDFATSSKYAMKQKPYRTFLLFLSPGILKVKPRDQSLFSEDMVLMEDDNPLHAYGITMHTAKAQAPVQLGLSVRSESGDFEDLDVTSYSSPPDLPDVMKNQDASAPNCEINS